MGSNETIKWLRSFLPKYVEAITEHDKGGKNYICPLCGSGTHKNGTGAFSIDPKTDHETWKCFACDQSGDIFDLIEKHEGITDFIDKIKRISELMNLPVTGSTNNEIRVNSINFKTENRQASAQKTSDYSEYINQCKNTLKNSFEAKEYLHKRGISEEVWTCFDLGYNQKTKSIIFPISKNYYIARSIEDNKQRYLNSKGETDIFNADSLYNTDIEKIFITEGVFDALSVIEANDSLLISGRTKEETTAISLNSTSNTKKLIKKLEKKPTKATLILALDNDEAGEKATTTLKQALKRLNISHIEANISGKDKDPNEALINNYDKFLNAVAKALDGAENPESDSLYELEFIEHIDELQPKPISTGFKNLDNATKGGIYPGVYVIGATSSLGKTTFCDQLADNIARNGKNVIYFSMEQSRKEMLCKSIARTIAQYNIASEKVVGSFDVCKLENRQFVMEAFKKRGNISKYRNTIEGNFNCNISFIGNYLRRFVANHNKKPVVIVDYLQIIQPTNENRKSTAKENMDNIMTELKRLSRELDIVIVIISSVNRSNYLTPIDFESFKESGGIEYTADVVLGLQLQCLDEDIFNSNKDKGIKEKRERVKEAKAEKPRKIKLVCLKNRFGKSSFDCYFKYYCDRDLFLEEAEPPKESTDIIF